MESQAQRGLSRTSVSSRFQAAVPVRSLVTTVRPQTAFGTAIAGATSAGPSRTVQYLIRGRPRRAISGVERMTDPKHEFMDIKARETATLAYHAAIGAAMLALVAAAGVGALLMRLGGY